jgi:predicted esterase
MIEKHIKYTTKARYYTSNEKEGPVDQVIYVLHGYGQLAYYFLRKFRPFFNDRVVFVAPEAPYRYYLNRNSGRVGATWMTKEDRLTDIENYVSYLEALHSEIMNRYQPRKITVLGFSQGAATASRWVAQGKILPDRFILWASVFPPDMDYSFDIPKLNRSEVFMVCGSRDEFIDDDKWKSHTDFLIESGLHFIEKRFDGTHDIDIRTLGEILNSTHEQG